nr:hypothetical protein GCM10020093_004790 [Planobispora longispora]
MIDGLSPFGTFWRVILPLARPSLAVTAFYSFMTAWGEVAYATVFMTGTTRAPSRPACSSSSASTGRTGA